MLLFSFGFFKHLFIFFIERLIFTILFEISIYVTKANAQEFFTALGFVCNTINEKFCLPYTKIFSKLRSLIIHQNNSALGFLYQFLLDYSPMYIMFFFYKFNQILLIIARLHKIQENKLCCYFCFTSFFSKNSFQGLFIVLSLHFATKILPQCDVVLSLVKYFLLVP